MKKILSISCADWAFNLAMFLLRIGAGALIIAHGYDKLVHFAERRNIFLNFLGLGSTFSLALVVFAEFFCGMFIVLGLFTRLTVLPLVITMLVALFKAHHGDIFGDGERAALYLICFLVILLCGPGKASVDAMMGR